MKIEDLKLFITVVNLGGFSAAANALELPRSNVSRRINQLEKELGVTLFFRTTRQLSLTNYGQAYFEEVQKALEALERAHQVTTNISESPKGRIKVGLLPETDEAICPILFRFQDLYPEVELDIRSISNGFIDTYQQDLDIAFHAGEVVDSSLVAKQLIDLERLLVASPEYINRSGVPRSIDQLSEHNTVCYRWPNGQIEYIWNLGESHIEVKGNISSNSIGVLKHAVIGSRGIAFLPKILLIEELRSGKLVNIFPEIHSIEERGWLLYPETKGISKATRLLIDYLCQEIPKLV